MKNKLNLLLSASLLTTLILAGCSNKKKEETTTSSSIDDVEVFDVTFKNYNELELYVAHVEKGKDAVYEGETPTKEASVRYEYTFNGWDKDLTNVQESFTTYAQYLETLRKYTVTFVNDNGEVLQNTKEEYGSIPVYSGPTPTKAADAVAQYTFRGWDKPIVEVQGDVTYTAVYDASYAPEYRTTGLVYQVQGYNEYYSVIAYFGEENNVAIPQIFDGLPVKGIKAGAFSNHDHLENVFIPNTVINIEPHVFDNCGAMKHITVGEGNPVYHIDNNGDLASSDTLVYTLPSHSGSFEVKDEYQYVLEGAFSCSGINTLAISANSFTTLPELFSVDAAHMPEILKSIVVKGGDINDEQFMECIHIESISLLPTTLYAPVQRVGDRAFKNCASLKRLVFSDDINYIGDEAFMGCVKMENLTIGRSENVHLTHVGKDAFANLPQVSLYDESGLNVSFLGNPQCKYLIAMEPDSLTKDYVIIPEETVCINSGAFKDYPKLKTVTLQGAGLLSIGSEAFLKCVNLTTLDFHLNDDDNYLANVNYIPYNAFNGCTKLLEEDSIKDNVSNKAFFLNKVNKNDVIGKDVLGIAYNAFKDRGEDFTFTLEEGNRAFTLENNILKDINDNCLCGIFNTELTGVHCGGEIVYAYAFAYQHISTLTFGEGLKTIEFGAFYNGRFDGTRIDLPNSLQELKNGCFQYFYNEGTVSAQLRFYSGDNLYIISDNAFRGTRNVELYTPFAEKPEGWAENYNAMNTGFHLTVYWNY